MKAFKLFPVLFMLFTPLATFAHSGEDHGPKQQVAPKGGILKEVSDYHVELVTEDQNIMLYFYDLKMNPITDLKALTVKAFTALPRKEKKPIELTPKEDHFHTRFDPQGAHRFTFHLELQNNGAEDLQWVIH